MNGRHDDPMRILGYVLRAIPRASLTKRLVGFAAVALLAGCSPPQPINFSVQNMKVSSASLDADLRSVTVTPAAPNERTGDLPPDVASVTNTWKEATIEALTRAAIFNDESHTHVNLEIKILKFYSPGMGITFPTETDVRYTLIDRGNGSVIFSQMISAVGTTPMDFALIGVIRARESVNRSAQNNIAAFIDALGHSPNAITRVQRPIS